MKRQHGYIVAKPGTARPSAKAMLKTDVGIALVEGEEPAYNPYVSPYLNVDPYLKPWLQLKLAPE